MAILIVDDETTTRDALRELLLSMGHKVVLDAKNGVEALRFVDGEKNRLRMIISDWEMPYMDGIQLLDAIAQRPDLDLVPFALITSDLPQEKFKSLRAKYDRLDGHLIKPFQKSALSKLMLSSYQHRQAMRSTLICLGVKTPECGQIQQHLGGETGKLGHRWIFADTIEALKNAVDAESRHLGGIVIQPDFYRNASGWLTSFKKTPLGAATLTGCSSVDPSALAASEDLRICSQFFSSSLQTLLEAMNARRENGWETEMLFQQARTAMQAKQLKPALLLLETILKREPAHSDAQVLVGDVFEQQGDMAGALRQYQMAIQLNPFSPRANIKLLEGLSRGSDSEKIRNAANAAVALCPQSLEVLVAAASIMHSRELAERALAIQPSHRGAKELLEKFKAEGS